MQVSKVFETVIQSIQEREIIMIKVRSAADIGSLMRKKRNELGMTQSQLADIAGNGTRFISDIENGKQTMQIGKILDTLQVLGFDVSVSARGESDCS